jgi:preprotein translocase subunit SecE
MVERWSPKSLVGVRIPPGLPFSLFSMKKTLNSKEHTVTTFSSHLDSFKWVLVLVLFFTSTVSFYYFAEYSLLLRVVSLLVVVGVATFIASTTKKGQSTLTFVRETHLEVRRVVWPTRQETLQMTGIVSIMVILVALIIWLMDSFLLWTVRFFTGQGG